MQDLVLHIYYGNNFYELDPKSFSKTGITVGGKSADVFIDSSLTEGSIVIEKGETGLSVKENNTYEIMLNSRKVRVSPLSSGDSLSINAPGQKRSTAVILVQNRNDYPYPDRRLNLTSKNKVKIGRGVGNNIIFAERMISEEHAAINNENGKFILADNASRNGTFVNGVKIKSRELQNNDVINICGNKLVFNNGVLSVPSESAGTVIKNVATLTSMSRKQQSDYPYFQRSPRLIPQIPEGEIEIPQPPAKSEAPSINWLSVLMPGLGMLLMAVVLIIIQNATGGSAIFYVFYVVMAAISAVTAVVNYKSQKKKHVQVSDTRASDYEKMLGNKKLEIEKQQKIQKDALLQMYPDKKEALSVVLGRRRRLWERTPGHKDFLSIRLGVGYTDFSMKIVLPKTDEIGPEDPLISKAKSLVKDYASIKDIPITLNLKESSPLGLIGGRKDVLSCVRNIAVDIAVNHSYDEVKIVTVFNQEELCEWDMIRWLPHVFDKNRKLRYIACNKKDVSSVFSQIYEEIRVRELSIKNNQSADMPIPAYVFLLGSRSLIQNEQLTSYLLNSNKAVGIFSVMLFDRLDLLPGSCESIVEINNDTAKILKGKNLGKTFTAEKMSVSEAETITRSMAPVRLKKLVDPYDLPAQVTFLEMYGSKSPSELGIEERWIASEPYTGISAPVGIGQNGKLLTIAFGETAKDFGLHGLVAGTIGSGKSELMQTLILSLSVNYHPHDVAFVLIDYKGGAMANAFKKLPHLAGIITNLGGNQTDRALISINSEIVRRQKVLEEANVDHIHKYQRKYRNGEVSEPMPHLFIIVDEFAELKTEKPEFIHGLVSAARLGRSLGVKLILATQKPAGVVDEQIKGNTGYNICLKVQSPGDSKEILERPEAALLNNPGRAYIRVGTDHIFEQFQSAWSGADYYDENKSGQDTDIYEVDLSGRRYGLSQDIFKMEYKKAETQLQTVVEHISNIAKEKKTRKIKSIWLEPLPEILYSEDVTKNAEKGYPVIGLVDNPAKQEQYPFEIDFVKNGHICIFGAPSTGKTTLLKTLTNSISNRFTSAEYNLYIIDFGSRSLKIFEEAPVVGGVVTIDQNEKLKNLFKHLEKKSAIRKQSFAEKNVSNFVSYNMVSDSKLPAVVLIIDNYPAMTEVYPETEDIMVQLTREGETHGIFVVMTANAPGSVKYKVSVNIKTAISLQLTDKADYSAVVGRTNGLEPLPVPGRGILKGSPPLEFQTALPAKGETEAERNEHVSKAIEKLRNEYKGEKAENIPEIPKELTTDDLYAAAKELIKNKAADVPVGIDFDTILPVIHHFADEEHVLITGQARSGKTTFIISMIELLVLAKANTEIYLFDSCSGKLAGYKGNKFIKQYARSKAEYDKLSTEVAKEINSRRSDLQKGKQSKVEKYIIIDDYHDFTQNINAEILASFETLIKRGRGLDIHIILSGLSSDITSGWDGFVKAIKDMQTGILLSSVNDQQIFNIRIPYAEASRSLKLGEAYYIRRGETKRIKTSRLR